MMICEKCKQNKATVHLTKILNNKKMEMHLCEDCARKGNDTIFENPFTINNFLTGLLDSVQASPLKVDYIKATTCSKCGMTYGKYKQLGRLGCANCYGVFRDKLTPLIKNVHRSTEHTGKIPEKAGERIKIVREIANLKHEIQQVLANEEYEKAAILRDRIKKLEIEALGDGDING